jgi:asparagine synthase (glutamine-hydrolysing)
MFGPDAEIFRRGLLDREKLLGKYERYCNAGGSSGGIWFREIFAPLALEVWFRRFTAFVAG